MAVTGSTSTHMVWSCMSIHYHVYRPLLPLYNIVHRTHPDCTMWYYHWNCWIKTHSLSITDLSHTCRISTFVSDRRHHISSLGYKTLYLKNVNIVHRTHPHRPVYYNTRLLNGTLNYLSKNCRAVAFTGQLYICNEGVTKSGGISLEVYWPRPNFHHGNWESRSSSTSPADRYRTVTRALSCDTML